MMRELHKKANGREEFKGQWQIKLKVRRVETSRAKRATRSVIESDDSRVPTLTVRLFLVLELVL